MSTNQVLLDNMELLNRELLLQSGEADVTRGLTAATAAMRHFEAMVAQHPGVLGSAEGTTSTAADTETTTFPAGLLRIDRLQYEDPDTNRPAWDLQPLYQPGEHAWNSYFPWTFSSSATTGRPRAFYTDGSLIYWDPLPDGTHVVRYYGFTQATALTTAAGTFPYPDICIYPFAAFAVRLFKIGLEDSDAAVGRLGHELFGPVIQTLSNFRRTGAVPVRYRRGLSIF
jgi:hypothetical protein